MLADFSDHLAGPGFLDNRGRHEYPFGSQFAVLSRLPRAFCGSAVLAFGTSCWIFYSLGYIPISYLPGIPSHLLPGA